ncbi:MAG: hypothetical protein IT293_04420 [Deltaproteobacteria bacterium]|nr:hypothetical protein [Deltaproteobacteria bacterium]
MRRTTISRASGIVAMLALTAAAPSGAQQRDHLQCHTIKDEARVAPALASLETQLGVASHCKVTARARLLCEEASVDGGDGTSVAHRGECP